MKKPFTVVASGVVVVALIAWNRPRQGRSPSIAFSRLATITTTNASFMTLGITNYHDRPIVCVPCPPQTNAGNHWLPPRLPMGTPMQTVPARSSGVMVVPIDLLATNCRLPVLWGFTYTPTAGFWAALAEDLWGKVTRRNPGGRGSLYTNYVSEIRLNPPDTTHTRPRLDPE